MDSLLNRANDFYGYVGELVRWVREKGKSFSGAESLLECGAGICEALREAESASGAPAVDSYKEAARLADEICRLLGSMVEAGLITEIQSRPIIFNYKDIREQSQKLSGGGG